MWQYGLGIRGQVCGLGVWFQRCVGYAGLVRLGECGIGVGGGGVGLGCCCVECGGRGGGWRSEKEGEKGGERGDREGKGRL